MISDTLKFIDFFDPNTRPETVPYKKFKDVDGLKKPSKKLAQRQWKQLSRRRFLNKAPNKEEYLLSDDEREHLEELESEDEDDDDDDDFEDDDDDDSDRDRNRNRNRNRQIQRRKMTYDQLRYKYNLDKLDAAVSVEDNWDSVDVDAQEFETMQERYQRKKEMVIENLYAKYDLKSSQSTRILTDIAADITCTFKSLLFINCVHLATQKNWLAFFLNPGCLWFSKNVFNDINVKTFLFPNEDGMLNIKKYFFL